MLDRLVRVFTFRSPEKQRQAQAEQITHKVEELTAMGIRVVDSPDLEKVFAVGIGELDKYLVYRMISHERGHTILESWNVARYGIDPSLTKVEREHGRGPLIVFRSEGFDQSAIRDFMEARFSLEATFSYIDSYQIVTASDDRGWSL